MSIKPRCVCGHWSEDHGKGMCLQGWRFGKGCECKGYQAPPTCACGRLVSDHIDGCFGAPQAQLPLPLPIPPQATPADTWTQGTKHDGDKLRWDLAPWDAVGSFVEILTFGARKYSDRNWEKGIKHSRLFAATQRHLTAWWQGEDLDPETGKSHLAHAACDVLFMLAFVVRGRTDLDDRPGLSQGHATRAGAQAECDRVNALNDGERP